MNLEFKQIKNKVGNAPTTLTTFTLLTPMTITIADKDKSKNLEANRMLKWNKYLEVKGGMLQY